MNINKKVLTLGSVCLLMLGGCSKEDGTTSSTPQHDLIEADPVKIELSSQTKELVSATTRAALEGDANISGVGNSLGIFGLARAPQVWDSPSNPYSLTEWNWDDWNDYEANRACILKNVEAEKVSGNIVWKAAGAVFFYPITQVYAYDFYGYYPYKADNQLVYAANNKKVSVQYEIDGTQDLLWGRATSTETDGYSARYFRQSSGRNTDKPNIALQHLLTRLTFSVLPGASYTGGNDYEVAQDMVVEKVQILGAKNHLEVTIADWSDITPSTTDDLASRISPVSADDPVSTEDFTLCDALGATATLDLATIDCTGTPTAKRLGESIMLYPEAQYMIHIELTMKNPNKWGAFDQTFVTEVPLYLLPAGTAFEAGKSYNVTITVHGPRDISLQSTITDWVSVNGPSIVL